MKYILILLCLSVSAAKSQVNYINYQSPVKSQYNRGTCSAFSLLSAMEVLPGFPNDLSEQHAYALAKAVVYNKDSANAYSEGATFADYIQILNDRGIVREDQMPYNPYLGFWQNASNSFGAYTADISGSTVDDVLGERTFTYTLDKNYCTYKTFAEARDVEFIKKQLDNGVKNIPVSYFIKSEYWSAHRGNPLLKMDPDAFMRFIINGKKLTYAEAKKLNPRLEDDVLDGKVNYSGYNGYDDTLFRDGHAVSIIGYDNSGFIIKNSWGKDWGNGGYGWLSFNYHRLFVKRLLVIKEGRIKLGNAAGNGADVNAKDIYLKSMPSGNNEKGLLVSLVYHGNGTPPLFKSITYKVFGRFKTTPVEVVNGISIYSSLVFEPRAFGYQAELLTKEPLLDFIYGYYVVAEMELQNGRKITNTYYHIVPRNKEYEPGQY